jgi:hypothetical protein
MRIFLQHACAIGIVAGCTLGMTVLTPAMTRARAGEVSHTAQTASATSVAHPSRGEARTNPVADPKAVVTLGKARFTVLTPEMVRMGAGRQV